MTTASAFEQVDDVERVGAGSRSTVGRLRADRQERLVDRRGDRPAPRPRRRRAPRARRRRPWSSIASRPKVSTTRIASSPNFAVSARAARCGSSCGQLLLVGARVRAEHDAAAAVVRRGARALAGAAGALLAVRLACRRRGPRRGSWCRRCPSGDRPAGRRRPGGGRPRSPGAANSVVGEVDAPDGRAGAVVEGWSAASIRPSSRG
mgnify:CR=1 FL=1